MKSISAERKLTCVYLGLILFISSVNSGGKAKIVLLEDIDSDDNIMQNPKRINASLDNSKTDFEDQDLSSSLEEVSNHREMLQTHR